MYTTVVENLIIFASLSIFYLKFFFTVIQCSYSVSNADLKYLKVADINFLVLPQKILNTFTFDLFNVGSLVANSLNGKSFRQQKSYTQSQFFFFVRFVLKFFSCLCSVKLGYPRFLSINLYLNLYLNNSIPGIERANHSK